MATEYTIPLDDLQATLEVVGGKGASLSKLANAGLPVPDGFHVTTMAYREFVAANDLQPRILAALEQVDPAQPSTLEAASQAIRELFDGAEMPAAIASAVAQAYADLAGESQSDSPKPLAQPVAVAVRSSATAEDLPEASFAGQQDTYLNVRGAEAVLRAVKRCWASLWTARAIGYRERVGADHDLPLLAVVVQMLVPAKAAGIMFTANPVTGKRDQVVISAAWGLGEAVVGGLVTPDSLTVDKATGEVLARETADKQVMTVRVEGGTEEKPVPEESRDVPVLDDEQAAELVRLGVQIEELYGMPMDIEWALTLPSSRGRGDGGEGAFTILQARPITALPEAAPLRGEVEPPTEWPLPDPKGQYVRTSIVELLPDPLTPLFSTLGRAAINAGTKRLMAEFLGIRKDWPDETVPIINGYAYYSARFPPKAMLKGTINMPVALPRAMRNAETQWRDVVRVRYIEVIQRWQAKPLRDLSAAELLTGVRQIMDASYDLYALYQSAMFPKANVSEMLFTSVYDRLIKREGDPPALTYLVGFDTTPILAEKSLYDIAEWCRSRPVLAAYVADTPAAQLVAQLEDQAPTGVGADDWHQWQERWDTHLRQFGHIIYDYDFAKPVPADDPAPLMDTCKMFLSGQLTSPYERQQAAAERRERAIRAVTARLKGLRLKLFRKLLTWAQKGVPLREEGLADLGLGYPHLRQMLLELGRRLVEAGAIAQPDDVFWLYEEEAQRAADALDQGKAHDSLEDAVDQRKAAWRVQKRATPPPVLPPKSKWMGLDLGTFAPAEQGDQDVTSVIRGAGTSPGRVSGTARVLHGAEDFDQMQPGDILVAAITTPAWTPLFARAAAIVTDVGGQLSHGSIVAREYGIPAVMGTGVATKRIQSGQEVTVDGDAGEVVLHQSKEEQAPSATIEWKGPNPKGQYLRASVVDLMPNPVSPLFATLAIPAVAGKGVREVMRPLTRSEPALPDNYILTINSYAYINASYTLREWWWILTRMMLSFPRILREAIPLWRDEIRPRYAATVERWQARAPDGLSVAELWTGVQEVDDAAMLHFASLLVATTGASAGSELLFTRVYEKMIRRKGDPAAATFLMGYDSTPIRAEKSLYDLAEWVRARDGLAMYLQETPTEQLIAQLGDDQSPVVDWPVFRERLQAHLHAYGHIIYDLDFAKPLPLDDPTPMLETVKMYLRGEGVNPHERQRTAEEKRVQAAEATLSRLKGPRRWAFRKTLGMAQAMAEVREDALADIGLGYPLLREMLHELGRRFVQAGVIAQPGDIFWLQADEVRDVIANSRGDMTADVAQRKATHEVLKRVTPPPTLPPRKKYLGFDMEAWTPPAEGSQSGGTLKGIGASAGRVTAPARVLRGPQDFGQMSPGDVLVAGTTTPAWTPLFAMASAVVTDIGGPLSHGSIVAREYGIPAVMGTGVATKRIRSGQTITVDGSEGVVVLV